MFYYFLLKKMHALGRLTRAEWSWLLRAQRQHLASVQGVAEPVHPPLALRQSLRMSLLWALAKLNIEQPLVFAGCFVLIPVGALLAALQAMAMVSRLLP